MVWSKEASEAPPIRDAVPMQLFRDAVAAAGSVLPGQGPITVFIHHNTLHAFEDLPFERAVVEGGRLFGCEPFLQPGVYREAIASGRLTEAALRGVVADELGTAGDAPFPGGHSTADVLMLLLSYGVVPARDREIRWLLQEGDALRRLRQDLPETSRRRILDGPKSEPAAANSLWRFAEAAAERIPPPAAPPAEPPLRLRDLLLEGTGIDSDLLVDPFLIRVSAAYLDQGISQWPMRGTSGSFHAAVSDLYAGSGRGLPDEWLGRFARLLDDDRKRGRDEWESLIASVEALGVPTAAWPRFLEETALALRGWAGMFRQLELRPDRVPVEAPGATLAGFLAIRLLAERAAGEYLAADAMGWHDPLAALRERLVRDRTPIPVQSRQERAWELFEFAQLLGLRPDEAPRLSDQAVDHLVRFLHRYTELDQRRLLHLAYERSFYDRALGTLAVELPRTAPLPAPAVQVVCCIDEREESFRRHLEEIDPDIETFGYAGFFAVPMAFRGIDEAHSRPLCPVAVVPEHEVREKPLGDVPGHVSWRRRLHREFARRRHGTTLIGGTFVSAVTSAFAVVPLVLRVMLPHSEARLMKHTRALVRPRPRTALALERGEGDGPGHDGLFEGFTTTEMADIVHRVLEEAGMAGRLAPLVLVIGHGSTSLNNPHESAHDCGACGGGRGGPNARAFAAMANNANVRALLGSRGVRIPDHTWFVGGEHNTCNDSVELFDVQLPPPFIREQLAAMEPTLEQAAARNAHERSRRYESFSNRRSEVLARRHVEARANDLAQPRPEYGHATNALCVIGPRERTKGLFLDRRAFLVSYDPHADPGGLVLARLLEAVMPVVAGISLEYYFSVVDPTGYGCGTKLPHNVSGLLGVMDGHASDLRTGLPWQMVEIHEPMRLLVVIEAAPAVVSTAIARNASLRRIVANGWIRLFVRDPESRRFSVWGASGFEPTEVPVSDVPRAQTSREWYEGATEHLPFARIVGRPAR